MRRCGLLLSSVVLLGLAACGSDTDLLSLDSLPVLQDDFGWVEPQFEPVLASVVV